MNISLSISYTIQNIYLTHPLFLLNQKFSFNYFNLFSTKFKNLNNYIIYSKSNFIFINEYSFSNSLTPIYLNGLDQFIEKDFKSRYIANSTEANFHLCSFHALISRREIEEEMNGGAVTATGYKLNFTECLFAGNTAVSGGSCNFNLSTVSFTNCNFSTNLATSEGGAIYMIKTIIDLKNCIFVQNRADLSSGAIRCFDTQFLADSVIFHENKALTSSTVLEADNSKLKIESAQFSGNKCDYQPGGTVIILSSSTLVLLASKFSIVSKRNDLKRPISADEKSSVFAKMTCFDTSSDQISKYIAGVYKESLTNQYDTECSIINVIPQQPFDVIEHNGLINSKLFSNNFIIILFSYFLIGILIALFMLIQLNNNSNNWIKT